MMIATRKIQGAFRRKQARKKLRAQRAMLQAEKSGGTTEDKKSAWVEVYDPSSGFNYYYNTDSGETTWEKPTNTQHSTKKHVETELRQSSEKPTGAQLEQEPTIQGSTTDQLDAEDP